MPDQLQLRGGTTTEHNSFTGVTREVTVDTTKKTLVVHDGSTQGGVPLMRESGSTAATSVQIGTGGVERFKITNGEVVFNETSTDTDFRIEGNGEANLFKVDAGNDRIGIGTASPDQILHLNKSSGDTYLRIQGGTNQGILINKTDGTLIGGFVSGGAVGGGVNDIAMRVESGNNMLFAHGTSERMRIDSSGRVSIGSTSGVAPLNVKAETDGNLHVRPIGSIASAPAGSGVGLDVLNDAANAVKDLALRGSTVIFRNASAESLRIDSSGRLLLGTTTEGFGTADDLTIATSGDTGITIRSGTSNKGNIFFSDSTSGTDEFKGQVQYDHDIDALILHSNASPVLTLDSSGRALLGTSSTTGISSSADDIVIGSIADSTDRGITLATSGVGSIRWADAGDNAMGRISYSNSSDYMFFATDNTERMRIDSNGAVSVGSTANTYGGSILAANGYYVSAFNGDNLVTNSSQGGGSATLYIGNAAIQVSSDQRIKKDIVDTTLDATTKLKQVRVVDFKWNDPTDKAEVNRNSRGTWTGCLAQEMVNVFPYTVNAPRKADNSIDTESERTWGLEYQHLVPALIKGFQEQQAEIETLKTKVAALEAA